MKPVVAIVGRPNVGKSTLYNRIVGRRDALVDNIAGVTRDRLYGDAVWDGRSFVLVDTGGFVTGDDDPFAAHIRYQVEQAVSEADAVIMVLDGKYGLSPFDHELILWLRALSKPVFFCRKQDRCAVSGRSVDGFLHLGVLITFILFPLNMPTARTICWMI